MARSRDHNASYDHARLLAVVGIIWFHAHAPGAVIGYAGLAFFLLLLVHLALPQAMRARPKAHRAPAFWRYAAGRGQRLLLPWLIASVAYGLLKLVDVSRGAPFGAEFRPSMWLTGPALHLWFLPFAFAVCLALWPLGRWLRVYRRRHATPLAFVFAGVALMLLGLAQSRPDTVPLAQWTYAMPIVTFGVALTLMRTRLAHMLGLLIFFVSAALAANWTGGLVEITLAALLLIACRAVPLPAMPMSALAARWALALFLIHPAVVALLLRGGFADGTVTLALAVTVASCAVLALWEVVSGFWLRPRPALA